jgi:hypothetical protein
MTTDQADRFEAHTPLFTQQFSRPGQPQWDGFTDAFVFSTGRRVLRSMHSVVRMLPRHDLLQVLWQFAWSNYDLKYTPEDRITLDLMLDEKAAATLPDFVFAIVTKNELSSIKEQRWDLTFTKTTENSALPPTLSVMSGKSPGLTSSDTRRNDQNHRVGRYNG